MQEQPGAADAERLRQECLAAVRAYADAPDAETRSEILDRTLADLAAQDGDLARDRLREWVIGGVPVTAMEEANYTRFQQLLPLVLAGAPGVSYADLAWFMHYLSECESCLDEYIELRHALDEEHSALKALYNRPPGDI